MRNKVNPQEAIELLKQGKTVQEVASHFGVTKMAISLHKKRAIETGQLPPVKTKRVKKNRDGHDIDFDRANEMMIEAFIARRELPKLKAENEKLKTAIDKYIDLVKGLEVDARKKRDQALRFKQAQQEGILPDFTEHIDCALEHLYSEVDIISIPVVPIYKN